MEISPKVTAAIDKFFAANERASVAELLAQYGDAVHEREAERIHLLILKISRRDVERIRGLVEAAKRDYRDVIAGATQSPAATSLVCCEMVRPLYLANSRACSLRRSRSGSAMTA
jgi:hypothetical protein